MRPLSARLNSVPKRMIAGLSLSASLFLAPSAYAAQEPSMLDKVLWYLLPAKPQVKPQAKPAAKPSAKPAASTVSAPVKVVRVQPQSGVAKPASRPLISSVEMQAQLRDAVVSDPALSAFERKLVVKFYEDRGYEPAWFAVNPSPNGEAEAVHANGKAAGLRKAMIELKNHGLKPTAYWNQATEDAKSLSPSAWKTAEILYSRAFVKAAIDLNVGRLNPDKISRDIKVSKRSFQGWTALQAAVTGQEFVSPWVVLAPQAPGYERLHAAIQKLRLKSAKNLCAAPVLPSKLKLQIGSTSPTIGQMKAYLAVLGHHFDEMSDLFDVDFETAVKDVQKSTLQKETAVITPLDKSFWKFFSKSCDQRIEEIALTMEKYRWLPNKLEDRHLFINLATQRMNVVDPNLDDEDLLEQKVIVGKATPQTRTPTFRNVMTYVVMNPTWTVPTSIFFRSKIGMLREMSSKRGNEAVADWFFQNGFQIIYNDNGNKYLFPPERINWFAPNEAFQASVTLRQLPRYDNALGVVKFLLNNDYSIWLHDTNERTLFRKDERMLSSGCIRLENPRGLAAYLLARRGYSQAKVEATLVKPGQMDAKEAWVNMTDDKLPVYTMVLTANAGDDGIVRFTQDLYGENAVVQAALTAAGY